MRYRQISFFFALFILMSAHSAAQLNYAGKNFFLTVGGEFGPMYGAFRIVLESKHHANVEFRYTNTFWGPASQFYTVAPGIPTVVSYNLFQLFQIANMTFEQVDDKGLQITSDSNITVRMLVLDGCADDGTQLLPVDNQAKARKYFLTGLNPVWGANFGHYSYTMVATCDSILLEIIPAAQTETHVAGQPFTVMLNKGESYQLTTAETNPADLSGTEINVLQSTVNVPISLFCSYQSIFNAEAPGGSVCCADNLLEQLLPLETWDTLIPIVPIHRKRIRVNVLSSVDANRIYFDNNQVATLNKGQVLDTILSFDAMIIRADHPVAVTEYNLSESTNLAPSDGDPDMLWAMAPGRGITEGIFKPLPQISPLGLMNPKDRLHIISPAENINTVKLDNISIANKFLAFPADPAWMYASIKLDSSDTVTIHHFESAGKVTAFYSRVYEQGGHSYNLSDLNMDSLSAFGSTPVTVDSVYKCKGMPVGLVAANSLSWYWSTGESGAQSISVTDTGWYWVKLQRPAGCDILSVLQKFYVVDTQLVTVAGAPLYDTMLKCAGAPLPLIANTSLGYLWDNGDTLVSRMVDTPGLYTVKEFSAISPCVAAYVDHTFTVIDKEFPFYIGNDTLACEGDRVPVVSRYPNTIWSTGDTASVILVTEDGTYTGRYIDSCGVEHIDSITVSFHFCPEKYCTISFPSIFSPNGDGVNDVFRAIDYGEFKGYYLTIYNRWGQMVYQTYNINEGWNGYFKGEPADVGTYMYYCQTFCTKRGSVMIKGDVTLLH